MIVFMTGRDVSGVGRSKVTQRGSSSSNGGSGGGSRGTVAVNPVTLEADPNSTYRVPADQVKVKSSSGSPVINQESGGVVTFDSGNVNPVTGNKLVGSATKGVTITQGSLAQRQTGARTILGGSYNPLNRNPQTIITASGRVVPVRGTSTPENLVQERARLIANQEISRQRSVGSNPDVIQINRDALKAERLNQQRFNPLKKKDVLKTESVSPDGVPVSSGVSLVGQGVNPKNVSYNKEEVVYLKTNDQLQRGLTQINSKNTKYFSVDKEARKIYPELKTKQEKNKPLTRQNLSTTERTKQLVRDTSSLIESDTSLKNKIIGTAEGTSGILFGFGKAVTEEYLINPAKTLTKQNKGFSEEELNAGESKMVNPNVLGLKVPLRVSQKEARQLESGVLFTTLYSGGPSFSSAGFTGKIVGEPIPPPKVVKLFDNPKLKQTGIFVSENPVGVIESAFTKTGEVKVSKGSSEINSITGEIVLTERGTIKQPTSQSYSIGGPGTESGPLKPTLKKGVIETVVSGDKNFYLVSQTLRKGNKLYTRETLISSKQGTAVTQFFETKLKLGYSGRVPSNTRTYLGSLESTIPKTTGFIAGELKTQPTIFSNPELNNQANALRVSKQLSTQDLFGKDGRFVKVENIDLQKIKVSSDVNAKISSNLYGLGRPGRTNVFTFADRVEIKTPEGIFEQTIKLPKPTEEATLFNTKYKIGDTKVTQPSQEIILGDVSTSIKTPEVAKIEAEATSSRRYFIGNNGELFGAKKLSTDLFKIGPVKFKYLNTGELLVKGKKAPTSLPKNFEFSKPLKGTGVLPEIRELALGIRELQQPSSQGFKANQLFKFSKPVAEQKPISFNDNQNGLLTEIKDLALAQRKQSSVFEQPTKPVVEERTISSPFEGKSFVSTNVPELAGFQTPRTQTPTSLKPIPFTLGQTRNNIFQNQSPVYKSIDDIKNTFSSSNLLKNKSFLNTDNKNSLDFSSSLNQDNLLKGSIRNIQVNRQVQSPELKTFSDNKLQPISSQELFGGTKSIFKITNVKTPDVIETLPDPFIPTPFTFKKKKDNKRTTAYKVLVKKKGIFQEITSNPLTKSEALKLGRNITSEASSASFKLKPINVSEEQIRSANTFGKIGSSREFYQKDNVFIQKRRFRIGSIGEKREITFKGIQANKQRNVFGKLFKKIRS